MTQTHNAQRTHAQFVFEREREPTCDMKHDAAAAAATFNARTFVCRIKAETIKS